MAALYQNQSDQQLAVLIRAGDESAFAELYRRYAHKIFAFASKILKSPVFTEDVTHDVFVKLWENRASLDAENSPVGMLFTIARNKVFTMIKRAGKEAEILDEIIWFAGGAYDHADLSLDIDEARKALNEAVDQLPPQRQRIYRMCREEGLTYNQVAEQLELSSSTVNSQMVKALKSIRTHLLANGMLSMLLILYTLKK